VPDLSPLKWLESAERPYGRSAGLLSNQLRNVGGRWDDGVRLYIGDDTVIDDWQRHSQTVDSYARHLEAGQAYKIRLEYFEDVGSAIVGFSVTRSEGCQVRFCSSIVGAGGFGELARSLL